MLFCKSKGQPFFLYQYERKRHTDCLGRYSCDSRSRCSHFESVDQGDVTCDIGHAGDGHKNKRGSGISHSSENSAEQIVSDDTKASAAAYLYVLNGLRKGLFGRVHQICNRLCGRHHCNTQNNTEDAENPDACADHLRRALIVSVSDALTQQHGCSHGKPCHNPCDYLHGLAPCGYSGNISSCAEFADCP